jgi:hypothetical protein
MQRVHRRRNQVYEDKDFQIQSLTSLVRTAKEKASQNLDIDVSDTTSVHLPLHKCTDRLFEHLQQMNHHLQSLLMKKLGPDARNVIAAERSRENEWNKERRESLPERYGDGIVHLSEIGQDTKDELELLNEYRERYASILAELLVVKDRLRGLETNMIGESKDPNLNKRLNLDMEESSDDEAHRKRRRARDIRRRRSTPSGISDDVQGPAMPKIGWKMWSRDKEDEDRENTIIFG